MDTILDVLRAWYVKELAGTFPDCWVFGSVIYQGGAQFDFQTSDIDLVVLLPDKCSIIDRIALFDELRSSIHRLEQTLLQSFSRTDASSHITSVIPVTRHEVTLDVHKSGDLEFFAGNEFLSLKTNTRLTSPLEGPCKSPTRVSAFVQAIEKCQSYRNQYVACSVNGSIKVSAFDTTDIFPKELARSAAQVAHYVRPMVGTNKWDLNIGSLYIINLLNKQSQESTTIADLQNRCLRRMGRGAAVPEASDIAILHELLFENALTLQSESETSGQSNVNRVHIATEFADATKKTVIDEGDDERIVWLLPRGFILIEHVQFEDSVAWGIVLHYYDSDGGWQQGTHYHSSYRKRWETHEGKRTQLHKLGVPVGDWQFAEGALWLVARLRENDNQYDILKSLSGIPTASKYTRYFGPGSPIILERLDQIYAAWPIPAEFRDILAQAEDLLLMWDKSISRDYLQVETRSLRHHSLVAAENLLGKESPSLRFVIEQVDAHDEDASLSALKKWVERLRQTFLDCLSVKGK